MNSNTFIKIKCLVKPTPKPPTSYTRYCPSRSWTHAALRDRTAGTTSTATTPRVTGRSCARWVDVWHWLEYDRVASVLEFRLCMVKRPMQWRLDEWIVKRWSIEDLSRLGERSLGSTYTFFEDRITNFTQARLSCAPSWRLSAWFWLSCRSNNHCCYSSHSLGNAPWS